MMMMMMLATTTITITITMILLLITILIFIYFLSNITVFFTIILHEVSCFTLGDTVHQFLELHRLNYL